MTNGKKKGARGEREWSAFCHAHGYETRRTQQYCGGTEESADVIGLPGIHQEVKRVERLNIEDAMMQAVHDSVSSGNIPIVAHRRNHEKWKVTMYADDWFQLYREWEAGQEWAKKT